MQKYYYAVKVKIADPLTGFPHSKVYYFEDVADVTRFEHAIAALEEAEYAGWTYAAITTSDLAIADTNRIIGLTKGDRND